MRTHLARAGLALALGLALSGCGESAPTSPLQALCEKDGTGRGQSAEVARTECGCMIGVLRERMTAEEFSAFEAVAPIMERNPSGPTTETIAELLKTTGLTVEQMMAVGQKAAGISREAQQTCVKAPG